MKILIIDDERSIRNTLKEILEFEGHEISLAEDGASGLEAAATGNFDVIFCDIKMPGMDGVEVLDKLSESGNEAPVVMSDDFRSRFHRHGCGVYKERGL